MSSILTNTSSMVALETLRGINKNLSMVQNEISSGKKINSAKDNAAVWAISTVMTTDVQSFKQITDSLNTGSATVGVARAGAEEVTKLLQEMKDLVVSAQADLNDGDRARIQTDIEAKRTAISNVVNAAQFNGQNLLKGTDALNILASLDRSADGTVTATNISVGRQDLTSTAGVYGSGASLATNITAGAAAVDSTGAANQLELTFAQVGGDTSDLEVTVNGTVVTTAWDTDEATTVAAMANQINALGLTGITASTTGDVLEIVNTNAFTDFTVSFNTGGTNTVAINNLGEGTTAVAAATGSDTLSYRAEEVALSTSASVNEGDSYRMTVNGSNYDYIAGKGETMEDVARGLKAAVDGGAETGVTTKVVQESGQWKVLVDYDGTGAGATIALADNGQAGGEASGGLFGLDNISVLSASSATAALDNVETLLSNVIGAAAAFGSAQGQVEGQTEFVQTLIDALNTGIGAMVDADMEAASAKLQAIQVQQQLGIQALSIANQSPQALLALFR